MLVREASEVSRFAVVEAYEMRWKGEVTGHQRGTFSTFSACRCAERPVRAGGPSAP